MIIQKFIDREKELQELRETLASNKQELVIIYGRRRIGKTELILEATKNVERLYYLAVGEKNLERFSEVCVRQFPDAAKLKQDWEVLFGFLRQRAAAVIIDEFQNLIKEDSNILHIFQSVVDVTLKGSQMKLFLLGSSVSIMTSRVLAHQSPLYGRRTGSLELRAVPFSELKKFFPQKTIDERVAIYGFAGGVPFYLVRIEGDFWKWLESEAKAEKGFLRDEVEFLMKYEFAEASTYKLILEALANGKTTLGEIKDFIKAKRTDLSPYVRNLIDVGLIRREVPITENLRSRLGRYYLADHFLRFWFRYIYTRLSSLEEGAFSTAYIKADYPAYLGCVFERVAKEFLLRNQKRFFTFTKIGRWWWRDNEIEVVAFDEQGKQALFAECKWKENVDAHALFDELKKKAALVRWNNRTRKEQFVLFAKSFRGKLNKPGLTLVELQEMDA